VQPAGQVAAGEGQQHIRVKAQDRPGNRQLQARRAGRVAGQRVGCLQGKLIHRPANGHPVALVAVAPQVLHGGQQAEGKDLHRCGWRKAAAGAPAW